MPVFKSLALAGASLILLSACTVGPAYERPDVTSTGLPTAYKALDGWKVATPGDLIDRGDWWTLLGDPQLDALIGRVNVSNQTIAAAEASYRQARALVREQRASLFPTIDLSGSATRTGGSASVNSSGGSGDAARYQASIGAGWEPDLWGRIRQGISGADASAQASAADLAGARLSMQGELALNYLGLRQTDVELALVGRTVEGYQRSLQITQNRYAAAIAPKSDVLQATTQLAAPRPSWKACARPARSTRTPSPPWSASPPAAFAWPPTRRGAPASPRFRSGCLQPCWSAVRTSPPPNAAWPPPTPTSAWLARPSSLRSISARRAQPAAPAWATCSRPRPTPGRWA